MAHDDTFDAFNAEQRGHADDQRRALDYGVTLDCPDCGRPVPAGELATTGCPVCDADEATGID